MSAVNTKGKAISHQAYNGWPSEIKESYIFTDNSDKTKYINAKCKLCGKHADKIAKNYKGRICNDIETFGKFGTTHLLLPSLLRHLSSKCHQAAHEYEFKQPLQTSQTTIHKSFGSSLNNAAEQCQKLLNVAWFIAINERPFRDFPKLISLLGENGVTLPGSYIDTNACTVFVNLLASELKQDLVKTVKSANFVSFLADGSTVYKKRLSHEGELLYIRTAVGLVPKVQLCDFISMKDYVSASANSLTHALRCSLLEVFGENPQKWKNCEHGESECDCPTIPLSEIPVEKVELHMKKFGCKIVGASADGASVNFGCRQGVMTQMKTNIGPWFMAIHCLSHRLELAIQDALKESVFRCVDDLLERLFFYFRNSPKEWSGALAIAESLNSRLIKPPKSSGTRFVSFRFRALRALMLNWTLLVSFFSDRSASADNASAAKAKGFLKDLLNALTLVRCWSYMDILTVMNKVCKSMQAVNSTSVAHAHTELKTLNVQLRSLSTDPGENEVEIIENLSSAPISEKPVYPTTATRHQTGLNEETGGLTEQKDVTLQLLQKHRVRKRNNAGEPVNCDQSTTFPSPIPVQLKNCQAAVKLVPDERAKVVKSLIDSTQLRFAEFQNKEEVLSHIQWLDVGSWPCLKNSNNPSPEELAHVNQFQNGEVLAVMKHYETPLSAALDGFSEKKALQQFKDLKLSHAVSPILQQMQPHDYWPYVSKTQPDKRDLLLVVEIILSLPFSAAVVENGFSAKGRILSESRISLSHVTITDLLHFTTRKNLNCAEKKKSLIKQAAVRFVQGSDGEHAGLSRRRINKLCRKIKIGPLASDRPDDQTSDPSPDEEDSSSECSDFE